MENSHYELNFDQAKARILVDISITLGKACHFPASLSTNVVGFQSVTAWLYFKMFFLPAVMDFSSCADDQIKILPIMGIVPFLINCSFKELHIFSSHFSQVKMRHLNAQPNFGILI